MHLLQGVGTVGMQTPGAVPNGRQHAETTCEDHHCQLYLLGSFEATGPRAAIHEPFSLVHDQDFGFKALGFKLVWHLGAVDGLSACC